jgi:8-oxo-dGTP diphosphatase
MDIIKVVCGIIFNDNKVFICRRKPEKSLGGYWEFPGGKIERGEKYELSLSRELIEELGMKVEVKEYFKTNIHAYEKLTIELIAYKCIFFDATFQLTDHDSFEWVLVKDLVNWNLAPADIPIAKELIINDKE